MNTEIKDKQICAFVDSPRIKTASTTFQEKIYQSIFLSYFVIRLIIELLANKRRKKFIVNYFMQAIK